MKQINKNYILSLVYFFTLLSNNVENIKSYETTVLNRTGFLNLSENLTISKFIKNIIFLKGGVGAFLKKEKNVMSRKEKNYLNIVHDFLGKLVIVLKQMNLSDTFEFITETNLRKTLNKISELSGTREIKYVRYYKKSDDGKTKIFVSKESKDALILTITKVKPNISGEILLFSRDITFGWKAKNLINKKIK